MRPLIRGPEKEALDRMSGLDEELRPIGADVRICRRGQGSVDRAGVDGVGGYAAALEPPAQLTHEHDDGEL